MSRLKWQIYKDFLESEPLFIGLALYQCEVSLKTFKLIIRSNNGDKFKFENGDLTKAKAKARLELVKLGANFTDDIKKRRTK